MDMFCIGSICVVRLLYMCCEFRHDSFFFQAEDGIRDLVRSRGLGDVYKRQGNYNFVFFISASNGFH